MIAFDPDSEFLRDRKLEQMLQIVRDGGSIWAHPETADRVESFHKSFQEFLPDELAKPIRRCEWLEKGKLYAIAPVGGFLIDECNSFY